jgi:hypothetical protein
VLFSFCHSDKVPRNLTERKTDLFWINIILAIALARSRQKITALRTCDKEGCSSYILWQSGNKETEKSSEQHIALRTDQQ